jgi:cytochrome c5
MLVLAAIAGSAWAAGRADAGVDFTLHGTQPGLAAPMDGSSDCLDCHGGFSSTDRGFMPHSTWSGSMMANATRDPLFWAALDVANHDLPGVGDWCLRCHTPSGWLAGRAGKDGAGAIVPGGETGCRLTGDHDDPYETYNSAFEGNDFGGVACHLCHRQQATGVLPAGVRQDSGNLFIDDSLSCDGDVSDIGPCRIGPYRYPEAGIAEPPHAAKYSVFVKRGEFCGSCHDVTTPILASGPAVTLKDSAGVDTGIPFPIERTYSEWRASAFNDPVFVDGFADDEPRGDAARFGQTCQSCHMASSSDAAARACRQNQAGSRSGNLPVHELVGANAWITGVIATLYGGPEGLDREAQFARSVQAANDMLALRSAELALALDPLGPGAATLTARVRVTNLSGHKLPTGYAEGRRMWLQVEARVGANPPFWRSGDYDDATGTLDLDAQAKVYEVQQGTWDAGSGECGITDGQGREVFHFATSDCIRKDNRIPPRGFRGGSDPEIRPVGQVYAETSPGSGVLVHHDDTVYAIPLPPGTTQPVTVSVSLRHQVATREYVEFLRNEAIDYAFPSENALCQPFRAPLETGPRTQSRGQFMYDLWTANGRSTPVTMRTATAISTTP